MKLLPIQEPITLRFLTFTLRGLVSKKAFKKKTNYNVDEDPINLSWESFSSPPPRAETNYFWTAPPPYHYAAHQMPTARATTSYYTKPPASHYEFTPQGGSTRRTHAGVTVDDDSSLSSAFSQMEVTQPTRRSASRSTSKSVSRRSAASKSANRSSYSRGDCKPPAKIKVLIKDEDHLHPPEVQMSMDNDVEMKQIWLTKVKRESVGKKSRGNDDIDVVYKVEEFPALEVADDKGEYEKIGNLKMIMPNFIMLCSLLLQQEMQRTVFIIIIMIIMIRIAHLMAMLLMRRGGLTRSMMRIVFKTTTRVRKEPSGSIKIRNWIYYFILFWVENALY